MTKARFLPSHPLHQAGSLARVSSGSAPPGTWAQRVRAPHPADGAGEWPPGWGTRGWQGLSSTSACPHLPGRLAGGQTASPSPRSESFPLDGWPQGFRPQGLSHGRWLLQGQMGTTRAGMERSAHLPAARPLLSSPVPDGPRPGGGGPAQDTQGDNTSFPCGAVPLESFWRQKCGRDTTHSARPPHSASRQAGGPVTLSGQGRESRPTEARLSPRGAALTPGRGRACGLHALRPTLLAGRWQAPALPELWVTPDASLLTPGSASKPPRWPPPGGPLHQGQQPGQPRKPLG